MPYFINFLSSVQVWFIGGRVVTSTDILKDILIWFGPPFCIYLYFQPIKIERRLILLFSIGSFQFPRSSSTHFFSQCLEEKIRSSLLKNKFKNTIWRLLSNYRTIRNTLRIAWDTVIMKKGHEKCQKGNC